MGNACFKSKDFDYDLLVIGGGSGGLACAREASKLYRKMNIGVCDFVEPSPLGTSWGLGGTCVNVGCIPKKIMHQAALSKEYLSDGPSYGFPLIPEVAHDWNHLVDNIQDYIRSLNFGYRVSLNEKKIKYFNGKATFIKDNHTLEIDSRMGGGSTDKVIVTANEIVIAVGCRPRYMDIPGGRKEDGLCITSDDLFSLPRPPGKTLIVGGGYIGVECAGFLAGFGYETTLIVRSKILRGFDNEMADKVKDCLVRRSVRIQEGFAPTSITQVAFGDEESAKKLKVSMWHEKTNFMEDELFDTVILAIGRDPCTKDLGLEVAGVNVHKKDGKIKTNAADRTSQMNIYAIGDCAADRPELTPTAVKAGRYLAQRLRSQFGPRMVCHNVPTTIFTPVEYGCWGMSEEDANEKYGKKKVIVYQASSRPLEWAIPNREDRMFAKLVCLKNVWSSKRTVVGFHYFGPNAAEITQGFSICNTFKPTKANFDRATAIHPSCAEIFLDMDQIKGNGPPVVKTEC